MEFNPTSISDSTSCFNIENIVAHNKSHDCLQPSVKDQSLHKVIDPSPHYQTRFSSLSINGLTRNDLRSRQTHPRLQVMNESLSLHSHQENGQNKTGPRAKVISERMHKIIRLSSPRLGHISSFLQGKCIRKKGKNDQI